MQLNIRLTQSSLQENITVSGKQGGKLQGNASRKLLKCLDSLELELSKYSAGTCMKGLPYIRVLRAFDKIVAICFGNDLLPGWEQHLAEFTQSYRELRSSKDIPISITPKVGNSKSCLTKSVYFNQTLSL